jgi:short-subunit dehydrogenase involved in D-alanine esterification of teichoic acids
MHSNTSTKPPPLWLLTGASSGIGRAIALQLAEAGHEVIAWGRDAGRLAELRNGHAGILAVQQVDLGDIANLADAAQRCLEQWPALSGIIHCAGIQHELLLSDPSYGAAAIGEELLVNLAAPIELSRALLPHLLKQAHGRIVFVSSALAHAPKKRAATYNASKAGLHAFAQSLRAQLKGGPVQVLELIPPLVDTPMTAGRGSGKVAPEAVAAALLKHITLAQRLPERVWVGRARLLPWLLRLAPNTLKRAFLK